MRKLMLMAALSLLAPLGARAQASFPNPVSSSAREIEDRFAKSIVAAAAEMPADKYGYHPTPQQLTFGKIIEHLAESNVGLCAMISDLPAPQGAKLSETDPKDTLVTALKASFEFCSQALAKLEDSKLGDSITFYRGRKVARARALLELTDDLNDHYSQLASYLRLSGLLPPTAQ
jgi:hypothetical protein